jgi:hypothetical protein
MLGFLFSIWCICFYLSKQSMRMMCIYYGRMFIANESEMGWMILGFLNVFGIFELF